MRALFPVVALVGLVAMVAWAVSLGTLPPADFTFTNGAEVQTVDPQKATGQVENRIVTALFEGLLRHEPASDTPDDKRRIPLRTAPGVAENYTVSDDGLVYTFRLRPTARWSNGRPVTAHDFVWSWQRCLHPETASKYAYQLYYVVGAERYNLAQVDVGDRVEVEIDRRDPLQPFPRGTILRGLLREVIRPPEPQPDAKLSKDERQRELGQWRSKFAYAVEVLPEVDGRVDWDAAGKLRVFSQSPSPSETPVRQPIERCDQVLPDFGQVGVVAPDERTLVVTLKNATPYFHELLAFYTLFPVNRECIEKHGTPGWTKPANLVTNGAYGLEFRRARDRLRLRKNPHYWDAASVKLESVDALAVQSNTTALNLFLNGQADWITDLPKTMIPELKARPDFVSAPSLITYFYRLNVTRPPLDNVRVRRALSLALDRGPICEFVTKAGEQPALTLVPPGLAGYTGPAAETPNVERARALLAEAGFPEGRGLPKLEILFNTSANHHDIAQVIQQQWKARLGLNVELRNLEWGVYLNTQQELDYTISRAGWVGDYPDPNTFLDMFVTNGPQNQTGWSHAEYDRLIAAAAAELDVTRRLERLAEAEAILVAEVPIIPIYFYVSTNLVSPRVRGFSANLQDNHPLQLLSIERR